MTRDPKRSTVKVAAVQASPVSFDLIESLKKVEHFTTQAATEGVELVASPEAFLSAYPWRYAFDSTIGTREPRGREWYARYYDSAIAIPSPEFDILRGSAEKHNICIYIGVIEKNGGTLYCTAVLIGKDGEVLNRHRKLIPTGVERLVWGRGSGDSLEVVDVGFGKIGGLICWENYMPAARLALYQLGVEIYIAPNADDLPAWIASTQHIAKEGRCFVINVNQFCKVGIPEYIVQHDEFGLTPDRSRTSPSDYPPFSTGHHDRNSEGQPWKPDDIVNHGGSCIVGPLGTFIARPVWDKEEVIYATLKLSDLTEARMDFDPVGSFSRPDILYGSSLTVNSKPGVSVAFQSN